MLRRGESVPKASSTRKPLAKLLSREPFILRPGLFAYRTNVNNTHAASGNRRPRRYGYGSEGETGVDKRVATLAEAVAGIGDGATLMIGGFGGAGSPIELIHALIDRFLATGSPRGLTVINNNAGNGHVGLAAMI